MHIQKIISTPGANRNGQLLERKAPKASERESKSENESKRERKREEREETISLCCEGSSYGKSSKKMISGRKNIAFP